jgi:hypothetical protein
MIPKRTSFRSPWQNGIAERWVGSCRRDVLDHIVALNERHLKRLLAEYVRYHHEDRTHLGLEKATPDCRIRSVASGPCSGATRRAAPSLQSSRLVRIDFPPILNIYVCCTRKHRSCSPKYSRCVEARIVFGSFPSRTVSLVVGLKFWLTSPCIRQKSGLSRGT